MKLHLPLFLRKPLLACLSAVAACTVGSASAWAEPQNLTFGDSSLTWDAQGDSFVNEAGEAAAFAEGDNVSFTGESIVTLGQDITAGTLDIAAGADVTIDLGNYTLNADTISLSGTLNVGDSLSIASGSTLAVQNDAAVLDSALVLGEKSGLVVESAASLNNNSLTLQGGSNLILTAAGDGKTYTLFSGISSLVDKNGNTLTAGSYSINDYFDKDAPGSGFWADATLVLTVDGTLQLVRHNEMVKESLEITEQQTGTQDYSYYKSILFNDISSSSSGGAISESWGDITLSNNGSVTFSGNSSSSSGGAIYGYYDSIITLSNNGSVVFVGNTASSSSSYAHGGAICGHSSSTITLSNNGSVVFVGHTASSSSSSAYGGAIYGSTITLSNNGSVEFSGNTATSNGGAIYGGNIELNNNGSVEFSGNSASTRGGAIDGGTITLSSNSSVTFSGNTASSAVSDSYGDGGAINGDVDSTIALSDNGRVEFIGNNASGDYACGGAIYGGNIELNNNGSVVFVGNTASSFSSSSHDGGGAIYGRDDITLSNNGSVEFSGNSASGDYEAYGGAIYGLGDIVLSNNGGVEFTGNTSSSSGGAIYGDSSSTITLSNNVSVEFTGNTSSSSGGAISGDSSSTITLSNNSSVTFSGNTASYSGGAIYGNVTMTDNESVTFSGNSASGDYEAYGGAIHGSTITLSNNGSVEFSGNTATSNGGAIYGGNIELNNNGSVTFSGNSASAVGGAIDGGGTITLSNNVSVTFSGNTASYYGGAIWGSNSTITLSSNGSVTFSGNSASGDYAYGGAIYGSSIAVMHNDIVRFSGNTASYYGGAIYGSWGDITLSNNGSVTFSGNKSSRYGGAIYTSGSLHIRNNDSVEFAGNVEKNGSTYRLRSVYVKGGSGDVLNISAAAGKSVAFYDSIYVDSGATVNLNAGYKDAGGNIIEQKGDIIFTGATTKDDLYKSKGNVDGTEEEIRLSLTTEVNAMTNLYGGRLRIEDGAIYQGYGITVHEGSEATVRVKDATLSHSGYDLIFNAGTTLELERANTITGNLDLMSGSSLVFENSGEFGVTIHEGALSIADDVCVDVRVDSTYWAEEYGENWDMVLLTTNATVEDGSVRYKISPLGETWGYTDVAWTDGTLAISFKKGAESALWQNTSGDYRWNTRSVNWMDGKYHFANVEGASVALGQTGAGTITLEGAISIAGMSVETGSSYELVLAEGASLSVSGALNVAENSQLDMGFGLSLSSVDNRGDLSLADDLTVSGAITGGGSLSVQGAASAASVQVGSLSVDSLTLTDATAQNTIGSSVSMAGAVAVAGGLSIEGALTAASLQAGSLSVDSLTLTSDEALNSIGSSVSMAGAVAVAGGLSIEGALTAASLQAGSLSVDSLTLTSDEAPNSIGSSVSMVGAVAVAGSLEIAGNLSAPKVSVGGELKAASLQTDMLTTQSLNLTDAELQNSIGSSVSMAGAATVAGGLSIDGSLSAASLQTGSLSATSLNLTTAEAQNSIGSSVSMIGAATVAGGLNIEGSFSAASLQAGSLSATSLNLTTAEAQNSIGSSLSMTGNISVAGSLEIAGNLSAPKVSVGGELKAASLQTNMLTTQSLNLTDAEAQNNIGSSVSMIGAATVAGGLNIEGSLTASSLTATALNADSLELTAANTANSVTGDLSSSSVSLATGATLEVGGVLTADEIAFSGTAKAITAGSLGADSMNFVLDRAALESLGIGYRQSAAIVSADTAMANGFAVTLNGDSAPVVAAAYAYTIGVNGGAVQLAADYAYDGMQVWYRGGWVGDSSWTDYFIAGFDAVEGKETVDLGGAAVTGSNLYIAYEEGVTTSTVQNGSLNFEYIDMGGGQFELGEGAAATTDELYGKGETLVMHEGSTLDVTKLTLGTLALEAGTITVKNATLNTISGTEGTLNIASGGKVTVKSDVTLTGLNNEGSLSLGQKKLTVNALVDVGGNVTAGEVSVQSRGSRMATFDKLVADKVTVTNSVTAGRYTDDLSVGDGSTIGELVAETLEVRGGTVTLGRSNGSTEMSLLNLDLQEDATLVLNQQTALALTDTLTATENATVQLKQDASLSYGEVYLTNKKSDSVASVNAYGLAGEADLQVQNAHVVAHVADASIDYQLVNSTVENAAGGTLKVTHENNTLNGVYATGGNVEVYNVSAPMSLEELRIATGLSVTLMTCAPETPMMPEHEADVTVVGLAVFEKGATLNANLTLAAGSELRMEGPLHMGSTLELVSGADSITLSGSMLDAVMNLGECESYTLFTGVDALTLTFDGNSVTYQPGTLNEGHKVLASTYFSNFVGTAQENSLYITFNIAEVGGGELAFYQAPEPTTVTLSLLALAALAARRRRK